LVEPTALAGNGEALDNQQNAQLQAQLKKEYPELWRSVEEREGAVKQKELAHGKKQAKAKKKKSHSTGSTSENGDRVKQQIRKLSKLCKAAGVSFDDYVDGLTRESPEWKWLLWDSFIGTVPCHFYPNVSNANESKSKSQLGTRAIHSPPPFPKSQSQKHKRRSKRAKEEKKRHKKHKHKKEIETEDVTPSEQPAHNEQVNDEAAPIDARSFFQQLQKQEAAKEPVGTVHARGLPAPVSATAISTSDKWECSKAGCGHMNSKHAPACNKCGAMKRMTEWR
ncbi:Elongation factor 3-like protein ABCF transporter family, partial [Phytophthora palmivora]